jgi:Tfp pilus assembly PilM family ATPase
VKAFLIPRQLSPLRGPKAWAGIFFGSTDLELVITRPGTEQFGVENQTAASLPGGEMDQQTRWQSAAQQLRTQIDPREHRVATAIGCEDVLCQTLKLPSIEASELKQMLDLQIDNLTPLPIEEVVYSFEPLEVVESQTRVLVAIARKDAVNERVAALEAAGVQPEVVSVDALAVFRVMIQKKSLPQDDKLYSLVVVTRTAAHVVVHSRGLPVAVRSITCVADSLSTEEGRAALRRELDWTLVAATAETPHSGIGRTSVVAWGEELREVAQELAKACDPEAAFLNNGAAPSPALSLCLEHGADAPTQPQLNLLPDEWRQKRRAAQMRQRFIRWAIGLGVLYLVVLLVLLSVMEFRKSQLRKTETQIQELRPKYMAARQLRTELIAMQKQLDTQYSALEVLREVTMQMPENLKLNAFIFRKDQSVTLRGQAQSATLAIDFQSRLEKSPLFAKVAAGRIQADPGAGGLTRFDIVCTLKSSTGGPGGTDGAK